MKTIKAPKMKVLLVEDNPDAADLLQHMISSIASAMFDVTHVERLEDALKHLERTGFDVVLLDLSLPDSHGLDTVVKLTKLAPGLPIVVLTGLDDENVGLDAVRKGAQDYLVKGQFDGNLLSRVMRHSRERKWAEQQLKQAIAELAQSRSELLQTISDLNRSHAELKITQLQLIEAAKAQCVSRLVAGVAHEVKTPLATLIMGVDYLHNHVAAGADPHAQQILKNMTSAVEQADAVITELQEFSESNELEVKVEDLTAVVERAAALVKHELTSGGIATVLDLAKDLPPLWIDTNKLEQACVSVIMNAIEAMPHGGRVALRTFARQFDPADTATFGSAGARLKLLPGTMVVLAQIEDSGPGIPEDKLDKVFDPFYTSKTAGKGAGLGLTVTKKIVELHGGSIELTNRPSGGVLVTLLFKA